MPKPTKKLKLEDHIIEPLGSDHDREAFSCGEDALDGYLKKQASQDVKKRAAAVFILRHKDANSVIGYYALSSISIPLDELPNEEAKRLPRYPLVPATLLGRFAVGKDFQGSGLGQHFLMDALSRSLRQSSEIGSALVIVDAKDAKAREFYEHYGFIAFPEHTLRLFLPMATIAKILPLP